VIPVKKSAHLQSLHKVPVDEPPTKFPSGAHMEINVRPLSPPPHILPDPKKGAFLTDLLQRETLLYSELSNYLLKFPVNGLLRFPSGPLWRETPVSRTLFYTFPSQSPVNESPSMFPSRAHMEREALSPEPMVHSFIRSFIYICQSPQ
jgi:hypothetical protein